MMLEVVANMTYKRSHSHDKTVECVNYFLALRSQSSLGLSNVSDKDLYNA